MLIYRRAPAAGSFPRLGPGRRAGAEQGPPPCSAAMCMLLHVSHRVPGRGREDRTESALAGRDRPGQTAGMRTYGQYCPIARAAEILAERWTPLIVRNI